MKLKNSPLVFGIKFHTHHNFLKSLMACYYHSGGYRYGNHQLSKKIAFFVCLKINVLDYSIAVPLDSLLLRGVKAGPCFRPSLGCARVYDAAP